MVDPEDINSCRRFASLLKESYQKMDDDWKLSRESAIRILELVEGYLEDDDERVIGIECPGRDGP